MPSIRIGFSTDFNLTNEQVGIGTTFPTARLDVRGQILSDNLLGSGGVSSITRYDGFLSEKQVLAGNITVSQTGKGNLNSLSGEIVIENEVTVTEGTQLTGGRLDSLTVTGKFDLPNGGTLSRSATPEKGSTRFNSDLGQLEFYTGTEWRTTASYDGSGRGRGVFGAGSAATYGSSIEYINISSTGNSQYFGELRNSVYSPGAFASSTRGIFCGGRGGTPIIFQATIDYLTIASAGNSISFGSLTSGYVHTTGLSSSTKGIIGGSFATANTIEYVTISQLGNSLDFGDLSLGRSILSSLASPTRGIFTGGGRGGPAPSTVSLIDFITIASTGNATFFGDLTEKKEGNASCSNSTRGITFGGAFAGGYLSSIEQLTISSLGSSVDFGDLNNYTEFPQSCSTQIRGICAGGFKSPSTFYNSIDYITIATVGNAQDFGDLIINRSFGHGLSDSHGGLGGF